MRSEAAEKVGQLLLVGFRGTVVDGNRELRHLVVDLNVGGVILFQVDWTAEQAPRNIVSSSQVRALTDDIQRLAGNSHTPTLLVAADNEGGQVVRVPAKDGSSSFPSHDELGRRDDPALTERESRRIAGALSDAGINWNLAPVADVALDADNPIARQGRSFGEDPERVITHARAFVAGHRAEGILTCLKHFPGHGSSRDDSHKGFVDVTETARPERELLPYRRLIADGAADCVMSAHVFNGALDPHHPATLSRRTITTLLRGELGFQGAVVSDDLQMGAITAHYGTEEAAVMALQAGVDILLLSNNWEIYDPRLADRVHAAILHALEDGRLDAAQIDAAYTRVLELKSTLLRRAETARSGADR